MFQIHPDVVLHGLIIRKPYTGSFSTLRLLKTVYGCFPTTDAALLLIQLQLLKTVYRFSKHGCQSSACSDPRFREVPKHGYLSDTRPFTSNVQFNNHLQMASISPSPSRHHQMASLSPFPLPSRHRVQISGHSSVQSPFTLESRKANLPI